MSNPRLTITQATSHISAVATVFANEIRLLCQVPVTFWIAVIWLMWQDLDNVSCPPPFSVSFHLFKLTFAAFQIVPIHNKNVLRVLLGKCL